LLRLHRRLLATCCEPDGHPERAGWQARIVALGGRQEINRPLKIRIQSAPEQRRCGK
jgi:hypothetical protein